ncbi:MAG TPA: S4 domain-containing protein, partial [Streptosporangiaceae bacterium]
MGPAGGDYSGRVADAETGRVDSWIWSVRLVKTRSAAAAACRAGHVRVNSTRVK